MCKAILEKCMVLEKTFWKSTGIWVLEKTHLQSHFAKEVLEKTLKECRGFGKDPCIPVYTGAKAPAITKKRKVKNGFGVGGSWVGSFFFFFLGGGVVLVFLCLFFLVFAFPF